jgi:hypothetical protein
MGVKQLGGVKQELAEFIAEGLHKEIGEGEKKTVYKHRDSTEASSGVEFLGFVANAVGSKLTEEKKECLVVLSATPSPFAVRLPLLPLDDDSSAKSSTLVSPFDLCVSRPDRPLPSSSLAPSRSLPLSAIASKRPSSLRVVSREEEPRGDGRPRSRASSVLGRRNGSRRR